MKYKKPTCEQTITWWDGVCIAVMLLIVLFLKWDWFTIFIVALDMFVLGMRFGRNTSYFKPLLFWR
ncbi:hypothetical protein FDI85_gp084 [Erwinia phage Machina]|uniref:Uncharacterized protein n=1 Tax=Erwinia phage Machina TaxID=1883375 RepID=A0A1B2IF03_9CAUD|nr:hypothetical protein FDI85_gp084 [Erwinia phage Machina]ANZ49838.1 hypothetical protein MACHINA_200 [Erwinia phage Machina]